MSSCCIDKSFLRFKLARYFDIVDFSKDGTFKKKDFISWGDKAMESFEKLGNEVTDDHWKMVNKLLGRMYNRFTFYGLLGTDKKRYVNLLLLFFQMPGFKMMIHSVMKDAFKLYDIDGSGTMSKDEFIHGFLGSAGVSEEDALEAFNMIDTNGNGVLDYDELPMACVHYFTDLEENKYAYLYGKFEYNPETWDEVGLKTKTE